MRGDKLNKEFKESIETSSIERSTCHTSQHGNFMIIPEAQDTFKNKPPEQWENLLATAPRTTCKYTQAEMIWVPTYSMSLAHETIDSEEKKGKIQADQAVKRQKKDNAAENKENKGPGNDRPDAEDAPVPIQEAQVKRLKALVENLQSKLVAASASFVEAAADEKKTMFLRQSLPKWKRQSNS